MMHDDGVFSWNSIKSIEDIRPSIRWQHFEKLVAHVFSENGFFVECAVVKKSGQIKRQYDVIASSGSVCFAADCKRWRGGKSKASAAKKAAEAQAKRCVLLKSHVSLPIVPLIVTLGREGLSMHDGVPVVPIECLNAFINNFHEIEDEVSKL